MNAHLVIYNVRDNKRRRDLLDHIKTVEHKQLSESCYVILTVQTRFQIFEVLSEHLTVEDDLVVSTFDRATFGWHRAEVAAWIDRHMS
jgi:hypothetical protein